MVSKSGTVLLGVQRKLHQQISMVPTNLHSTNSRNTVKTLLEPTLAALPSSNVHQKTACYPCLSHFAASAIGLAHCRPVLGLDGCHLKGRYLAILLTATATD